MSADVDSPLVVDLDGTLLRSDLLLETGLAFVRIYPQRLLQPLFWLVKGKARLKQELAGATELDVRVLPYDPEVIELIDAQRKSGRKVVLATASDDRLAQRIAAHLQLFDEVIASDGTRNLSAHRKKEALVQKFGQGGFDYIGNSLDDVPIWESARRAYLVNPEPGVEQIAGRLGNVELVLRSNRPGLGDWIRALRFHQWLKNLLIFVPLLAAHRFTDTALIMQGLLAFLFFGLCASSVYVLNDLLDLGDDRHHQTKRHRPFAAGQLSIKSGLLAFPLLLAAAFSGALWLLPPGFSLLLAVYYVLTLSYSLWLKRQLMVDVIALALLYTVRIIAGTAVFGVTLTFWMLGFSMFMFLSLALVKRFAELRQARAMGRTEKARGRGYYPHDLEMIASLGASSGYMAVLVLALYINDPHTASLYRHPQLIWLACPLLLFWVGRIWMITHRGQMHDDPLVFSIRDRVSLGVGVLFGLIFWAAA